MGSTIEFGESLIKKALAVKAKPWGYEKEIRIIRRSDGLHVIDKKHLKQVCFGLATPDSDVTLAKKLIHQSGYKVALCKMERSVQSDFGLKASEI